MRYEHRWLASGAIVVALAAFSTGNLSIAETAGPAEKPARLEKVAGSNLNRVVLTAKAAERLAIATTQIREEPVKRWLVVGGEVEAMPEQPATSQATDADATTPTAIPVRVRVPRLDDPEVIARRTIVVLSLGENGDEGDDDDASEKDDENDDDTDDGRKVVVLTIDDESEAKFRATPLDEAMAAQYYEVSNTDHRLTPGQHVQVRLAQPDNGKPQKVIPYSAVMYDAQGATWVYTNPEPLAFVRQAIDIEYIHKNLAVLKDGPPTGTVIVSVGAAELMGVEQKIGN